MAVWSTPQLFETYRYRRIDSEFFDPAHVEVEKIVQGCNTDKLEKLGLFVPGPFGSAFHVQNYDYKSSFRYIRGRDVKPFFLLDDDNRYIPESDYYRLSKYSVHPDDIMISVVGTLGNVSICTAGDTPAVFSCKSTLFRTKEINPYYLLAYLNSHFGRMCLLRRQRGAVQTGLNIEDLRAVPVARFGFAIEEDIANLVQSSYSLAIQSKDSYNQSQQILETEIGLNKFHFEKHFGYTARFSVVGLTKSSDAGRIDAQCFSPEAVLYEDWLLKHANCDRLNNLLASTEKGRQQVEAETSTTNYCSIKHINGREIVGASKAYPSAGTPNATKNDLLLAITGATIGKIGIVNRYDNLVFSGDMLRLRANSAISPYYLLLTLDHYIGQVQFNRWITGSTNGHLSPRDVGRVLVPRLAPEVEEQIAVLVSDSLEKRQESESLLNKAKSRVEQLIEEAVRA